MKTLQILLLALLISLPAIAENKARLEIREAQGESILLANANQREKQGGDDPRDTPPPTIFGEEIDTSMCGDPDPVTRVKRIKGKKMNRTWYAPMPGRVRPLYNINIPRPVGHRKQVKFEARLKRNNLRPEFMWVQYIRGYVWSGVVIGGKYNGGASNRGQIVDIVDHRGNVISAARKRTDLALTIPAVVGQFDAPRTSPWTFDDLRSVGHYTTHQGNKKVYMRDTPGLDQIALRSDGRSFFDANFEFRAYVVCPLAPKRAYGRCVWNTRMTVDAFRVRRTADKPVCEMWSPPRNLLANGDPALTLPATVQRSQDYFDVTGGWSLHEDE